MATEQLLEEMARGEAILISVIADRSDIYYSTLLRWAADGVKVNGGRVHLDAVRCGGRWLTSERAWREFLVAQNPRTAPQTPTPPVKGNQRASASRKATEAASA